MYIHAHMHAHTHVRMHTHVHADKYPFMHAHTCMHACTCMNTFIYLHPDMKIIKIKTSDFYEEKNKTNICM